MSRRPSWMWNVVFIKSYVPISTGWRCQYDSSQIFTEVVTSFVPVHETLNPGVTRTYSTQPLGTKVPEALVTTGALSTKYLKPPLVELVLTMHSLIQYVCTSNG